MGPSAGGRGPFLVKGYIRLGAPRRGSPRGHLLVREIAVNWHPNEMEGGTTGFARKCSSRPFCIGKRCPLERSQIVHLMGNLCGLEPQLIKLEFIIYLPKLKVSRACRPF